MNGHITFATIYAKSEGYENEPAPEYRTSAVVELPYTIVRGCRTFVALDETGFVIARGLLAEGGDMRTLVDRLQQVLEVTHPAYYHRVLALVAD